MGKGILTVYFFLTYLYLLWLLQVILKEPAPAVASHSVMQSPGETSSLISECSSSTESSQVGFKIHIIKKMLH